MAKRSAWTDQPPVLLPLTSLPHQEAILSNDFPQDIGSCSSL